MSGTIEEKIAKAQAKIKSVEAKIKVVKALKKKTASWPKEERKARLKELGHMEQLLTTLLKPYREELSIYTIPKEIKQ